MNGNPSSTRAPATVQKSPEEMEFERKLGAVRTPILAYLTQFPVDAADRDVLLNEVLDRLWRSRAHIDPAVVSLPAVALYHARLVALSWKEERAKQPVLFSVLGITEIPGGDHHPPIDTSLIGEAMYAEACALLRRISPLHEQAFILFKMNGYSAPEVAERLGLTQRQVYSYVATSIKRLLPWLRVELGKRSAEPRKKEKRP